LYLNKVWNWKYLCMFVLLGHPPAVRKVAGSSPRRFIWKHKPISYLWHFQGYLDLVTCFFLAMDVVAQCSIASTIIFFSFSYCIATSELFSLIAVQLLSPAVSDWYRFAVSKFSWNVFAAFEIELSFWAAFIAVSNFVLSIGTVFRLYEPWCKHLQVINTIYSYDHEHSSELEVTTIGRKIDW